MSSGGPLTVLPEDTKMHKLIEQYTIVHNYCNHRLDTQEKKRRKAQSDRKRISSGHLPQTLRDVGDSEDRLRRLPRLLRDRVGRSRLELSQLVCVIAELFQIFPASLRGIRGEVVLADGNATIVVICVMFSPRVDGGVGLRIPLTMFWIATMMELG